MHLRQPSLGLTRLLTALTALTQLTDARHCAAVSATGEFYAFGTSAGDLSFGNVNASSTTSSATSLPSTSGRPPFDSNNTQCFTVSCSGCSVSATELIVAQGQYTNALYVLDGDSSKLSDVHIYDFAKRSWSVQATTGRPAGSQVAILVSDPPPATGPVANVVPLTGSRVSYWTNALGLVAKPHAKHAHSIWLWKR